MTSDVLLTGFSLRCFSTAVKFKFKRLSTTYWKAGRRFGSAPFKLKWYQNEAKRANEDWRSSAGNTGKAYLLPSVVHHALCVFEHFLFPKLEKVRRIGVEFQAVLAVLPERIRKSPIKAMCQLSRSKTQ